MAARRPRRRDTAHAGARRRPYLLVESPFSPAIGAFEPLVLDLLERGHRVLLAHPERCPAFHRDPERLQRLVDAGVLAGGKNRGRLYKHGWLPPILSPAANFMQNHDFRMRFPTARGTS